MSKELTASRPGAPTIVRPVRLTREQSRVQTRERILASAAIVFTREGYAGASVDRIAEEAGYSKGALYSNFASKDVLFLELVDYHTNTQAVELCQLLDTMTDAEGIITATSRWANELQHEPDLRLLVLDMTRRLKADVTLSASYASLFSEQWNEVGLRLLRLFGNGQAPATAMTLGALVMELAYGNATQFHAELTSGDLIGLALRALHAAHGQGRRS